MAGERLSLLLVADSCLFVLKIRVHILHVEVACH